MNTVFRFKPEGSKIIALKEWNLVIRLYCFREGFISNYLRVSFQKGCEPEKHRRVNDKRLEFRNPILEFSFKQLIRILHRVFQQRKQREKTVIFSQFSLFFMELFCSNFSSFEDLIVWKPFDWTESELRDQKIHLKYCTFGKIKEPSWLTGFRW